MKSCELEKLMRLLNGIISRDPETFLPPIKGHPKKPVSVSSGEWLHQAQVTTASTGHYIQYNHYSKHRLLLHQAQDVTTSSTDCH